MLPLTLCSIAFSFFSTATAYRPCPLLGAVFQPPTDLHKASILQGSLHSLSNTLDYSTKLGSTRYGSLPSNATSFSIGVFDASSPDALFSYQYSSPALQNGTQGVKHVTEDLIYRIGSGSKLVTMYLFLIEAGWKYLNDAITDFVPQLTQAARNCSAPDDPVDCIDWSEVTLGALASHMARIPRDCTLLLSLEVALTNDRPHRFDECRASRDRNHVGACPGWSSSAPELGYPAVRYLDHSRLS